jgi:hypothetical protein
MELVAFCFTGEFPDAFLTCHPELRQESSTLKLSRLLYEQLTSFGEVHIRLRNVC